MKLLNRNAIGKTIVYTDREQEYYYADIVDLINRWHTVFDHLKLFKGSRIAVFDTQSIEHVSLVIAAGERGLQYFAAPKEVFTSPDEGFDYVASKIKTVFVRPFDPTIPTTPDDLAGVGVDEKCYWNITQFDMSRLREFSPKISISFDSSYNDILILSQTSGTTGKPKEFAHTHESLMTASVEATKLFYKKSDKVLLYTTFNHVGVISTQLVPAMIAGAGIIGHYDFSGKSVLKKLIKYRPNKTIIFPSNLSQMMRLPEWENTKLDFIEEVITGGQLINKEFVNDLFKKGVSRVHNIYGSSEALPPVMVSTVTPDNVENCYNAESAVCLGQLVSDWKIKVVLGMLVVQGKALASATWISDRTEDGYYLTGDRAVFENNQYWTTGRGDKMVRHHDMLVNASAKERDIENIPGIRNAKYHVTIDDQLIIGLRFSSHLADLEKSSLVSQIKAKFRPDKVYELTMKNSFDAIKDQTEFSDEL